MQLESDGGLEAFLNELVARFEDPSYIEYDPIAVPHGFDDPRDQEVIGLYAALLAWGRRDTLLRNLEDLCERMQYRPFRFVREFSPDRDAASLSGFRHRTFQPLDAVWLTANLGSLLRKHGSIEKVFVPNDTRGQAIARYAIERFSQSVLDVPGTPRRLAKHLARPSTGSACKRLNMYLRWMVRPGPFDLGIWSSIPRDRLVLPLDLHSGRQARRLGMLTRASNDWRAAWELTEVCRQLDPADPCRYDLALFGIGAYDVRIPADLLVDG